jgi:uncharacterized protein (TIGR03000 family)
MYSLVLAMALSGSADLPADNCGCCGATVVSCCSSCCGGPNLFERISARMHSNCCGCSGSGWACHGCSGYSCHGCSGCSGCHGGGLFSRLHSCSGCSGCCGAVTTCCPTTCCTPTCNTCSSCNTCNSCGTSSCCGAAAPAAAAPAAAPAKAPEAVPAPKEMPKGEGAPQANATGAAQITVDAPANAQVFVGFQRMNSRTFVSPVLEAGKTYTYKVRADVVRDGQTVTETKEVTVRAGETTLATFTTVGGTASAN